MKITTAKETIHVASQLFTYARKGIISAANLMSGEKVSKATAGLEKRELALALDKARQAVHMLEELYDEMSR